MLTVPLQQLFELLIKFYSLIIIRAAVVPDDWALSIYRPLYKGDKKYPNDYRGISLASCLCKLFTSLITGSIEKESVNKEVVGQEQAGFRKNMSCCDHAFVLNAIISTYLVKYFGELGRVDKFVYLGHCVNASGGYEDAVSHRVQSARYTFRRLRGTLVGKHGLSLRQRGFIYSRCVRPVLLYSCETWSLTTNLKLRLQSTERRMVRMTCGVRLVDRLPSEELKRRLGIQPDVIECLETSILRLFGHVVRRKDTHPIKAAHNFSATGKRPPGRPKKTWDNAVRELLKARRLSEVDALIRVFWRSTIQGRPANLSQLGQGGNR